jgi:soluble lytic murein transglycosylase-like protein
VLKRIATPTPSPKPSKTSVYVKEAIKQLNPKELLQAVGDRFKGTPGSQDYKDLASRYFGQKSEPEKKPGFLDAVKRFNPREAYEGIKKTKLFNWQYQAGKGDDQEHSGPMAQEVRKNLGEDVAPKGKMIDLQSMNGALMASIQHLGEKVEGLFKRDADKPEVAPKATRSRRTKGKSAEELTNDLLAKIQKDTAETVKLLAEQQKLANELIQSGTSGGGGAIPNQLAHDGTYRGMITSIMRGAMDLGFKAGSGTMESLKEFFAPGEKTEKAKGLFTTAKDFLKDQLTDKESGTRKAFGTLYEKAASFSSTVFDSAKSFLTEGLPNGLKFIKDKVSKAFSWIGDKLNEAKDLYLPDGTEPVIRAVKLKAGFYRDAITGEVLDTMEKLNKAKGDIVDSAGNVVLSLEERAKGLYDRYGEKIRGNATNVLRLVTKGAAWVGNKVQKGFNALTDKSLSLGGKIKEWWNQPTDWGQLGINFGENKYAKDSYEVLLDIRDVLLNQRVQVLKRIKKREAGKLKTAEKDAPLDRAPKNLNEVLKEAKDEAAIHTAEIKAKATDLKNKVLGALGLGGATAASEEFVGPMQPGETNASQSPGSSGSLLSRGMDFFRNKENFTDLAGKGRSLKDKLLGRTPEDFVGPMRPGAEKKGWFDQAKGKFDELKDKYTPIKPDEFVGPQQPKAKKTGLVQRAQEKLGALKEKYTPPKAQDFVGPKPPEQMGPAKPSKFKLAQGKARGLLGAGASIAGGLASGVGSFIGGDKTQAAPTPTDQTQPEKKPSLLKRVKNKIDSAKRAWNDRDGSGTRDGSVEERDEKLAELKASRQKDEAKADLTARYKGGTGLMDLLSNGIKMAMTGFGGLFSLITKGLGGVMGMAGKLLAMTPGALVKGVAGVAKLAGKGAWGAAKLAGKGAVGLGRFALTRALPGLAMGALNVAGGAIGAVASVISSPVVLGAAALAGAGYGLYKLYQYSIRNDADEFERIRLNQYGFGYNKSVDQYNYYPFMLEAYLEDGRIGYDNGKAYINDKKVKPEELLELFKIDKEDTEQGNNFTAWFSKRFKPFFLTHMTALYAVNNKAKLKEVAKFKPEERIKYLELIGFESGPYSEDTSPIKAMSQLSLDNKFVKDSVDALIAKAKAEQPKDNKATLPPTKPGESNASTIAKSLFDKMTFGAFKDKEKDSQTDQAQKAKVEEERRKNAEKNKDQLQTATQSEDGGKAPSASPGAQSTEEKSIVGGVGKVAMAPGAPMDGSGGQQFVKFEKKDIKIDGLNPSMLKLFYGMAEEFGKQTGKSILVTSGVRTYEEQVEMRRKYGDGAAKPGNSLHEFGLALDIDSKIADELDKLGLMKKYGFTRPVGQEPWHVEPAGIQKNPAEAKSNSQLRDAMVDAGITRGGGGYGSMSNSVKGRRNKDVALSLLNAAPSPVAPDTKATTKDQVLPPPKFSEAAKPETRSTNTVDNATAVKAASDQNAKTGTPASKDAKVSLSQSVAQSNSTTNDLPPPDSEEKPASGGKGVDATTESGKGGDIKAQIATHAKRAGEDPALMQAFAAVESDMNPQAKASTSSAAGLFQFIRSTWDSMVSRYSSKYGLEKNASPFNVEASSLMAAEYIKENKKIIAPVKPNPNLTDLYLAHFLGASGAKAFLAMPPDAIAANRFPGPASKNQNIFYKDGKPLTAKQVYDNLSAKLNEKSSRYGVKAPTGGMGLSAAPSKGPGLDINPSQSPISKPMAGETASAQKASAPSSGPSAGQKKAPEAKSSNSGIFLDTRSPGVSSSGRVESGEGMAGGIGSLTSALDKSVGIQQESLEVLREILSNVKVEKVAEMMAGIVNATTKAAKATDEKASPKEQDKINLGRKDKSGSSALDMRRVM